MEIRTATRSNAKIKLAIQGISGSGKTLSSLLMAYGITNDWTKICLIDTEACSADLYSHLGNYKVIPLTAPFAPESYILAITMCEQAGVEVIIVDGISHLWEFLLKTHSAMAGNSFVNWGKITPRWDTFIQKILQSQSHIIATMRAKTGYVLNEKNGKVVPEKVGLRAICREGTDYEFTVVLNIDQNHQAKAVKDRTGIFQQASFVPNVEIGTKFLNWCKAAV